MVKRKKRILTVCLANAARSPTAEWLIKGQRGYKVKSCGVHKLATVYCDRKTIGWADRIITMERWMKTALVTEGANPKKVTVLGVIERGQPACDPGLTRLIKNKLTEQGIPTRTLGPFSQQACLDWWQKRYWNETTRHEREWRGRGTLDPYTGRADYGFELFHTVGDEPVEAIGSWAEKTAAQVRRERARESLAEEPKKSVWRRTMNGVRKWFA